MQNQKPLAPLLIGALGVVFGDIGTSPLYTLKQCFTSPGMELSEASVFGVLSLITWALIMVVSIKYVTVMLRADNRGEGGILALTTLALDQFAAPRRQFWVLVLGLAGAALFYGDTLITPAISVMSAVEGLHIATPALDDYVLPLSLLILIMLFGLQQKGTETVGVLFGPVMLVWFGVLGLLGAMEIYQHPHILHALNPFYAFQFIAANPGVAFVAMGAVVLAVTGAEALYADMGHFGRSPIRMAWLYMVFPCLLLNYLGQGALLLTAPEAIANPFFLMVPESGRLLMVFLATAATVIASQAVISGAFSITHQAIILGYLPRMDIRHTSNHTVGQVYIPFLNWLMCTGVTLLLVGFKSSSALADAYGFAVTGTMLTSTLLVSMVLYHRNQWKTWQIVPFLVTFVGIDLMFFISTLHKIPTGGWFPLVLGAAVFFVMNTWVRGHKHLKQVLLHSSPPLEKFLEELDTDLPKVPRTSVFLTSNLNNVPAALMQNVTHNGIWHAQTILVKISRARIPRYPASERVAIHHMPHGLATVQATYGFMEQPNIPNLIAKLPEYGLDIHHPSRLSYFIGNHTYVRSPARALSRWEEPVFITLDKFAHSAVSYFQIPRDQVIEIGDQLEI